MLVRVEVVAHFMDRLLQAGNVESAIAKLRLTVPRGCEILPRTRVDVCG